MIFHVVTMPPRCPWWPTSGGETAPLLSDTNVTPKHWCHHQHQSTGAAIRNRDHTISISQFHQHQSRSTERSPRIGVSSLCLLFEIQRLGFVNHRPEMFSIFKNIWRWFCLWSTNHPPLCLTTWHELQGITDLVRNNKSKQIWAEITNRRGFQFAAIVARTAVDLGHRSAPTCVVPAQNCI